MIKVILLIDCASEFDRKLLRGIVRYSNENGPWQFYRMPSWYRWDENGEKHILEWAVKWKADAIIGRWNSRKAPLLSKLGIPIVLQNYRSRSTAYSTLTGDYIGTGRMAARYYLERGFKHFGFFGFNQVCWSDERCEGFRREVENAGIGATVHIYNLQDIDHLWYYERDKLREWLRSIPKPIGIMACDDNQGNNLVEACHSAGVKIPSEVSVMGVDNDELLCSLGSTALSSIYVDIEDGGYRTAELIEQLVTNPDIRVGDVVLRPIKVVERISTAAFATDDVQIQKAVKFIHQNYQKKISVSDVMEEVALSRRLLERRFKSVTGQTLYQYISDQKIRHFAEMLHDTNDQVVNIALSLGETDTKSISRRFKQVYGCSPVEWREKFQKNQ